MDAIALIVQRLQEFTKTVIVYLPQIGIAIAVLLLTWLVVKIVRRVIGRVLGRIWSHRALIEVLQQLATVLLWLAGVLVAVTIVFPSMTPGRLVTAVGLGTVAIGFAFKDIFENFLAGILILLREPFRLNDFVECDGIEGKVEQITIRDTHIRQTDGQRVVIPNAILFKNPVRVLTDLAVRRTTVICGIAFGEDVDQARDVIRGAVEGVGSVRKEKPIEIFAQAFNESSIDFEVTWWTGSRPVDIRRSRDEVVAVVKAALDHAGIEIPFPYRTLTFKETLSLRSSRREEGERSAAE